MISKPWTEVIWAKIVQLKQNLYIFVTFLFGGCRQVFNFLQLAKHGVNGKKIFDIFNEGLFIGSGWPKCTKWFKYPIIPVIAINYLNYIVLKLWSRTFTFQVSLAILCSSTVLERFRVDGIHLSAIIPMVLVHGIWGLGQWQQQAQSRGFKTRQIVSTEVWFKTDHLHTSWALLWPRQQKPHQLFRSQQLLHQLS